MKKRDFLNLALTGISTGALVTSPLAAATTQKSSASSKEKSENITSDSKKSEYNDANDGNMNYHVMTADELLLQLDPEGIKVYNSLSPEGKGLALLVASQMCDHTNQCAGLNACQTEKNKCAGQGSCKGTGKCSFSDKNVAVRLVAKKMAEKRAQLGSPHSKKP